MKRKRIRRIIGSLKLVIIIRFGSIDLMPAHAAEIPRNRPSTELLYPNRSEFCVRKINKRTMRRIEKIYTPDLNIPTLKLIYRAGNDLKLIYIRNRKDFGVGIIDKTSFNIAYSQLKVICQLPRTRRVINHTKFVIGYNSVKYCLLHMGQIYYDFNDSIVKNNIEYKNNDLLYNKNNILNNGYYLN